MLNSCSTIYLYIYIYIVHFSQPQACCPMFVKKSFKYSFCHNIEARKRASAVPSSIRMVELRLRIMKFIVSLHASSLVNLCILQYIYTGTQFINKANFQQEKMGEDKIMAWHQTKYGEKCDRIKKKLNGHSLNDWWGFYNFIFCLKKFIFNWFCISLNRDRTHFKIIVSSAGL